MKKYIAVIVLLLFALLFMSAQYKDVKYAYFLEGFSAGMHSDELFFQRDWNVGNETEKTEILRYYVNCEYSMAKLRIERVQ